MGRIDTPSANEKGCDVSLSEWEVYVPIGGVFGPGSARAKYASNMIVILDSNTKESKNARHTTQSQQPN
jgi:hypothetical protein